MINSAWSGSRNNAARDGSWIVYCSECHEPVCRTSMQLGKVVCELCRRVANGEPLTNEAVELYRRSKISVLGVTQVNIPPPEENANLKYVRSMGAGIMQAFGFPKRKEEGEATKVVEEKRRGRLFEQVDLEKTLGDGTELGSMEEFDKMAEEAHDEG